jgi:hypothetical protein
MALKTWWYTEGLLRVVNQTLQLGGGTDTQIELGLLRDTYVADQTHDFYNDISSAEISVGGYARKVNGTAFTITIQKENTSTPLRIELVHSLDQVFSALDTGQTVNYAFMMKYTGTPSTSPLIVLWELTPTPTNGGDITLDYNTVSGNMHVEAPVS